MRRRLRGWRHDARRRRPCIVQAQGLLAPGAPGTRPGTFVVVCGPGFDQRIPNAATTSRMGWCHGFEALGIPYRLVSSTSLAEEMSGLPDPMVWISGADHDTLDDGARRVLAQHRHAVLVDPAFDDADRWYDRLSLPRLSVDRQHLGRVLSTGPRFVFTIASESGFAFYTHWWRSDVPLVSLPLACDTTVYTEQPMPDDVPREDMVFVGGYWRYKARQFEFYLEPYASRLSVYGYSPWPYGRYGGLLAREQEAALYCRARVSPVINEPHVPLMGIDLNERVFKVLGAGGAALTDATPAYRDWFGDKELLVPRTVAEFRELANALMAGEIDSGPWRRAGQAAVLARHTYRHRAAAFLLHMRGQAA
jgi:hypothetical protein